ncbi:SDR family NAD(P)-dependent oxidoreductase [Candidatus Woesearchaeota archaeon]|nr:SDR family NAD(P)-dependent oxidoreductase [Candidatus Woesearchaeota archaeon]
MLTIDDSHIKGKKVLVTGGTGSFGHRIVQRLLKYEPAEIRVYSRDEKKHYDMKIRYSNIPQIRFFLGDVRDKERLIQVISGVDIVYHAAALKHVPMCELHPEEAVKTNILGASNLIECAIAAKVKKVVAISTDKAVKPVNVMGMTKAIQEKLMISANDLQNNHGTLFSCVRYGNVMGSRGSAIPFFRQLVAENKVITITDEQMTRFMLTLDDAIDLVFFATAKMKGGEMFIKKAPSLRIVDLAKMVYRKYKGTDEGFDYKIIGIYPGEKIHEILISEEEISRSVDMGDYFVIHRVPPVQTMKGTFEEYSSKSEIVDPSVLEPLLEKAEAAEKETMYQESIYVK